MKTQSYCRVSAALFTVVALAHTIRLVNGWSLEVESVAVPLWASVLGVLGPGTLAFLGFRASYQEFRHPG